MYTPSPLPFFLWGRSAGAYLCLITAGHSNLPEKPAGLISYTVMVFSVTAVLLPKQILWLSSCSFRRLSIRLCLCFSHRRQPRNLLQFICICPSDREMERSDLHRAGKGLPFEVFPAHLRCTPVSTVLRPQYGGSRRPVR